MCTISEIKYYCNINNPAGALFLTGEWGSGKTYLIEHILTKELEKSHIIVRVSLFGMATSEDLHKTVKANWIEKCGGPLGIISKLSKNKGPFESLVKKISNKHIDPDWLTLLFSQNFMDYIQMTNRSGEKKVVLVFDDLERTKLDHEVVIGVINDYCENQHFNVIVIADEARIQGDIFVRYKEKVILRTLRYQPDYQSIVDGIIEEIEDQKYKNTLIANKQTIANLLGGSDSKGASLDNKSKEDAKKYSPKYLRDEDAEKQRIITMINNRPHNIRTLKAALQDFSRVFSLLMENNIDNIDIWLYSFLSFSMAAKANLLRKPDEYGMITPSTDVYILYPGYYEAQCMPEVLAVWILNGIWDEDKLTDYMKQYNKDSESLSPKSLVKGSSIYSLEEDVVKEGMKELLEDAYFGELTFDEYVHFIANAMETRTIGLLEFKIDWANVRSGIEKRIENDIQNRIRNEYHHLVINDFTGFSEEEIKTYKVIESARQQALTKYGTNKAIYIETMKGNLSEAFRELSNLQFNFLDREMADATFDAFKRINNHEKEFFPIQFKAIWQNYSHFFESDASCEELTTKSLQHLKAKLNALCEEYEAFPIKKFHTEQFIRVVDELLSK